MFSHILLPTDGSELAMQAVKQGLELAQKLGSRVTILTVCPPLNDFVAEGVAITVSKEDREAYKAQVGRNLDAAVSEAKAVNVEVEGLQVEDADPWSAIIDTVGNVGADLIVMGSHGRRGLAALVLGSETHKVLTHTKTPVLVCR